jgi:hypothetical protein
LDLYDGNILNDEEHGKTGKDQNENQFVIHNILPLSLELRGGFTKRRLQRIPGRFHALLD